MKPLSNKQKNEYYREMYAWRKAHHICVKCGQMNAAKGRVKCISCLEDARAVIKKPLNTEQQYANRLYMKRRYDLLTAFGVCVKCGKRNAAPGHVHCNECLLRSRRKDEAARRKAGIFARDSYSDMCVQCGKNLPVDGKKLCGECYEKALKNLVKANAALDLKKHIWQSYNSDIFTKNKAEGGTANEIR